MVGCPNSFFSLSHRLARAEVTSGFCITLPGIRRTIGICTDSVNLGRTPPKVREHSTVGGRQVHDNNRQLAATTTGRCHRVRRGVTETPVTWAEKFESFELINSIRETNGNFDSCNPCKRLRTSRLHELHE